MADRVPCGTCGAEWPEGARWCGACGGALETEAPRPGGDSSGTLPERPWWHGAWWWALGVGGVAAVVAAVAVVVAGPVGGDGASSVDEEGVALPDEEDLADPGEGAGSGSGTGSNMRCAPPGCEVWRFDDPVGPGAVASDDLVVHFMGDRVSGHEMIARDATDGRELWRRPAPGRISQNPRMTALSGHGLALVTGVPGQLGDGATLDDDPARMRLSVHDPRDGSHRFDVQLDADIIVGVHWVGERLVVQTRTTEEQAGSLAAFSSGGELLWTHEPAGPVEVLPDGQTLLERGDEGVRRIGVEDGQVRWEVAGGVTSFAPEDDALVFDRAAGLVHVVDLDDGTTRLTVQAEGAVAATSLGPWVLLAHEEEFRMHDRSSGELLFVRERSAEALDAGPMRMSSAVRVGDRVVVAWGGYDPGDEGLELEVRDRSGQLERTVVVPESDWAGSGPRRGPVALRHLWPEGEVVFVSAPGPTGTTVAVDLVSGEVLQRWSGMPSASRDDDLLALRREDGVSILGPGGELQVEHVREVASTDPLVVYGVGGIMRLDRSLVVDETS